MELWRKQRPLRLPTSSSTFLQLHLPLTTTVSLLVTAILRPRSASAPHPHRIREETGSCPRSPSRSRAPCVPPQTVRNIGRALTDDWFPMERSPSPIFKSSTAKPAELPFCQIRFASANCFPWPTPTGFRTAGWLSQLGVTFSRHTHVCSSIIDESHPHLQSQHLHAHMDPPRMARSGAEFLGATPKPSFFATATTTPTRKFWPLAALQVLILLVDSMTSHIRNIWSSKLLGSLFTWASILVVQTYYG